jgi:cellulose biosynthesis protein BcsQ
MARVIVIAQRKGGCGKTTVAVSLAATGVSKPLQQATPGPGQVCLVDLDSQSNTSGWALGLKALDQLGRGSTAAILAYPPMKQYAFSEHAKLFEKETTPAEHLALVHDDCVFKSPLVDGLAVVPMAPHIHPEDCRGLLLKQLPFHTVVVDTPADGSCPAVQSALQQADYVLIPTLPEPWATSGVQQIMQELRNVGRHDLIENGAVSVVINCKQRTRVHDQFEQLIRDTYGPLVSDHVLARCAASGIASVGPGYVDKKSALWKTATALWKQIGNTLKQRAAA